MGHWPSSGEIGKVFLTPEPPVGEPEYLGQTPNMASENGIVNRPSSGYPENLKGPVGGQFNQMESATSTPPGSQILLNDKQWPYHGFTAPSP